MYVRPKTAKLITAFLACLLMLSLCATNALAASVSIRTGEHQKYSRIVFEWNESFTYKLKKTSATQIKLSFNKAAEANLSAINSGKVTNLLAVNITEKSPLSLTITIPSGSKHRALKAGRKLILDIYSPATGKPKASKQQTKAKEHKSPKVKVVKKEPPSQKNLKESDKHTTEKLASQLPDSVKVDTTPKKEYKPIKTLQKASQLLDTNMITVSSTKSMGMSVFESDGVLWLVVDKDDIFVRPQAAGTKADELGKYKKHEIKGGQAFSVPLPGESKITTDGAGLLWRIKLSPPQRRNHRAHSFKTRHSQAHCWLWRAWRRQQNLLANPRSRQHFRY